MFGVSIVISFSWSAVCSLLLKSDNRDGKMKEEPSLNWINVFQL